MKVLKYALKDLWKSKIYTFLLLLLFILLSWALLVCYTFHDAAARLSSLARQFGFLLNGGSTEQLPGYVADASAVSILIIIAFIIVGAVLLSALLFRHIRAGRQDAETQSLKNGRKIKIIAQYLSGVLIVAVVSFGIAVFSGNAMLHEVENKLIQNAFSGVYTKSMNHEGTDFGNRIASVLRNSQKNAFGKDNGDLSYLGKLNVMSAGIVAESAGALCVTITLSSIPTSFAVIQHNKSL